MLASISTSLAEILGGAIALEMLLDIPIIWGAVPVSYTHLDVSKRQHLPVTGRFQESGDCNGDERRGGFRGD